MNASSIEGFLASSPLYLDVETTGLKADYGLALVIGVSPYKARGPSPVKQFIIDYRALNWEKAERKMLTDFRAYMEGRTSIITFNGTRFDVPYLQARLAAQGLPLLPKMRHLDLFYTVKRTFGYTITSRRAKYIQSLFRVGDKTAPFKDSSQIMTWLRATFARDRSAMLRIIDHNRNECLKSLSYQTRRLIALVPRTVPFR